jgi:hypothetical protein
MPKSKKKSDGKVKKKAVTISEVLNKNVKKEENMGLNKLKQVNGQIEGTSPNFKKTTISQVLGDKGYSEFGTLDIEEYTNKINKMDKYDLNVHAASVNVFPHENRQRLTKELLAAFTTHARKYLVPETNTNITREISPSIKKILNQGK